MSVLHLGLPLSEPPQGHLNTNGILPTNYTHALIVVGVTGTILGTNDVIQQTNITEPNQKMSQTL